MAVSKRRKMIARLREVQELQQALSREEKQLRRGITRLGPSNEEAFRQLAKAFAGLGLTMTLNGERINL